MGRVMRPAILDIEASGFGDDGYPIEVGVVLPNGRKYCSLVTPEPEWIHWDEGAAKLHGITRTMLATHGPHHACGRRGSEYPYRRRRGV